MSSFSSEVIAPCGMNCGTCLAYLRKKNRCAGCWSKNNKMYHCTVCFIINCPSLAETESKFCYDCRKFPCIRLRRLDKRYVMKYNTSLVDNLKNIQSFGLPAFLENEKKKWKCNTCGNIICVHSGECSVCKTKK